MINLSPSRLKGLFPGKTGSVKVLHMAFEVARDASMAPVLIYIDECEQVIPEAPTILCCPVGASPSSCSSTLQGLFVKKMISTCSQKYFPKSSRSSPSRFLIVKWGRSKLSGTNAFKISWISTKKAGKKFPVLVKANLPPMLPLLASKARVRKVFWVRQWKISSQFILRQWYTSIMLRWETLGCRDNSGANLTPERSCSAF